MKRPLAFVGFVYLLTQLLAAFLPPHARLLSAAFLVVGALWLFYKKSKWTLPALVLMLTVVAALFLRTGYEYFIIAPLQVYDNTAHTISGTVQTVNSSYQDGKINAQIVVRAVDETALCLPFKGNALLMPECTVGDEVRFTAQIRQVQADENLLYRYAQQTFLTLSDIDAFTVDGKRQTLPYRMHYLQEKSSAKICSILPREYGAVACAMVLGDKSMLTTHTKNQFKSAGIVHILVVSGLHLSVFSGGIYRVLRKCMNRKLAAAGACVGVVWFMLFAGFTPSVLRAGIAMLLVYGGGIFNQQSDAVTSLGFAALLLCVMNPYAAVDVGLLLSFSATLAVLFVGDRRQAYDQEQQTLPLWLWFKSRILFFIAIPLATTLATLPVLMAIGSGISLLSVLCNCIAVPLLPVVLLFGFLIVLCANIGILAPIFQMSGLICGICIKILIALSNWAANMPGTFVHLTGIVPLLCMALCGALFFYGRFCDIKAQKNRLYCSLFLLLCFGICVALDTNVVRIALVGESENPAVVITQNLKTAVIYRGAATQADDVEEYLLLRNRHQIDAWIDLRRNKKAELPLATLPSKTVLFAQQDLLHHTVLQPFRDIIITVYHQSEGNAATIDVKGYTFCVADGTVDFANQQGIEVYLAGKNAPQNLQCEVLFLSRENDWAGQVSAEKYLAADMPQILLRKGKSVQFQGVTHDFE